MRTVLILLLLCAAASADDGNALRLPFACPPGLAAHRDFLEKPALLALALENAGVPYKANSRIRLSGPGTFVIRNVNYDATVSFTSRDGNVYGYIVTVSGPLLTLGQTIDLSVRLDATRLAEGTLTALVHLPLGGLLPGFITEPLMVKSDLVRRLDIPGRLLAYLDGLAVATPGVAQDLAILQDAYNRGRPTGSLEPQPGDAGPLSDSALFLGTLLVWCAGFPALVWTAWRLRRGAARVDSRA